MFDPQKKNQQQNVEWLFEEDRVNASNHMDAGFAIASAPKMYVQTRKNWRDDEQCSHNGKIDFLSLLLVNSLRNVETVFVCHHILCRIIDCQLFKEFVFRYVFIFSFNHMIRSRFFVSLHQPKSERECASMCASCTVPSLLLFPTTSLVIINGRRSRTQLETLKQCTFNVLYSLSKC